MKGQVSFPIKVAVVVISIIAFMLVIYYYTSFTSKIKEEKAKIEFRAKVLNVLQKLVSSEGCLAYSGFVKSSKPVLDVKKIEDFVARYKDIEPDCAKALDFDYSVEIIQLPKEIRTYPGEVIKQTECGEAEIGFAYHDKYTAKYNYLVCDKEIDAEICSKCSGSGGELDGPYPGNLKRCDDIHCKLYDCSEYVIDTTNNKENLERCQLAISSGEKICCIYDNCMPGTGHPFLIKCYNIDPETDCKVKSSYFHLWCGSVSVPVKVPTSQTIETSLSQKIWSFSVSSGVSSFSPEKAKWDEIEISYPVTIRYDETNSVEGMIKIKAVRGELEKFVSILEDVCKKAEKGKDVYFADEFYFSYTVKKDGNKICMLDKCKVFSCSIPLQMDEIGKGEYYLKVIYDKANNKIEVKK